MKEYFYPLWLRVWHWLNALLFLILILTGISLQYSNPGAPLIPFDVSIALHNICGITLTLNYLFFFILNIKSGNYRQYIPRVKGLISNLILQSKYYLSGIFRNEPHPFETTKKNKFNPLQKVTYLGIMYFMLPVIILTGWALLFPELIIKDIFSIPGLLLTDLLHISAGFLLTLFMIGHIYLATTGATPASNFKSMINGWHEAHPDKNRTHNENKNESFIKN